MEYSKEAIIDFEDKNKENIKKITNGTSRIILSISLICTILIAADIVLICNFVRMVQSVL